MHDPQRAHLRHSLQHIADTWFADVDRIARLPGTTITSMAVAIGDRRWAGVPRSTAGVLLVVLAQVAIGLLVVRSPTYGVLAAIALVGGLIAMFSPLTAAAFAFPATIATWRLGGGGFDLSYADAVLIMSTLLALPFVPWQSRTLRRLLSALFVYVLIIAVTILANPSPRAVIELFHRVELVGGALVVGSAVAAAGKARFALRLVLAACGALAAGAVVYTLTHDLGPAYPFNVNKNAAGFLLTGALLVLVVAPDLVELPRSAMVPVQALLLAGLVACQSRASAATFLVVLFIAMLRRRGSRALLPVVGALALAAMVWSTSQHLTDQTPKAKHNALNSRLETYDSTLNLWADHPVFGLGLRFFRDPSLEMAEPHNVVISALGESGLVGTVGLVVFLALVIHTLRRQRVQLSRLAVYLVVAQFINALADIYWVAGRGTLPWLIVGLAAGEAMAVEGHGLDESDAIRETSLAHDRDAPLEHGEASPVLRLS